MSFSLADLGFWRLVAVTFILELLHLILEVHWPAIRVSSLEPRTTAAKTYMVIEFLALIAALAAGIDTISRVAKVTPRPSRKIANILLASLGLLGMIFFVLQR